MERRTRQREKALIQARKKKKIWKKAVSAMAAVVVFCTVYALILPAITLSSQPICGLEEHVHTEECYEEKTVRKLACNVEAHEHTDACLDEEGELNCGFEETVLHTHEEGCYDEEGQLLCGEPQVQEHTHDESCYLETVESVQICGKEEHTHSSECYPAQQTVTGEEALEEEKEEAEETPDENTKESITAYNELSEEEDPDEGIAPQAEANSFKLTYSDADNQQYTITFEIVDTDGNAIEGDYDQFNRTAEEATRYIFGAKDASTLETDSVKEKIAPVIDGYTYTGATKVVEDGASREWTKAVYSVGTNGYEGSHGGKANGFKFYTTEPLADGQILSWGNGNYTVTLTYTKDLSIDNLDGQSFAIVNNSNEAQTITGSGLESKPVTLIPKDTGYQIAADVTKWTFEKQKDGGYYISASMANGTTKYLALDADNSLTVSDTAQSITVTAAGELVTLSANNSSITGLRLCQVVDPNRKYFYIAYGDKLLTVNYKLRGADGTLSDLRAAQSDIAVDSGVTGEFTFAKLAPSIGNYAYVEAKFENHAVVKVKTNDGGDYRFYEADSTKYYTRGGSSSLSVDLIYEAYPDVKGTYAIVNRASGDYALGTAAVNGVGGLTKTAVSVSNFGGQYYATGTDVAEWTFTPVNQEKGIYTISTQVDGQTQYLHLGDDGSLTLSDSSQNIIVAPASDGKVILKLEDNKSLNYDETAGSFQTGTTSSQSNSQHYLMEVKNHVIFYDLNLPSMESKGTDWQSTPEIASEMQELGDAEALYSQPEGYSETTGPAGLPKLYRFNIKDTDRDVKNEQDTLSEIKDNWYGEERFDGWEYQADNDTVYLFEPGAAFTKTDAGEIQVTAVNGTTVTLPDGAVLRGKWTEVSNVVTFFVNYGGTILDVEGDVAGRNQKEFTRAVAVGHVFYGRETAGNNDIFATDVNAKITDMFQPKFDPANPDTQIVIVGLRTCTSYDENTKQYTTAMKTEAHGANSHMLEASTLKVLKDTGRIVKLSSADGTRPPIDTELCDEDHYEIRWYVMKEQTDTWHIDGVLVAKTEEISVTKTFTGLPAEKVDALMQYSAEVSGTSAQIKSFYMDVDLGETPADYMNMVTLADQAQYEYAGKQGDIQSYHWTMHAISDEKYQLTEKNYEVDGYDVSALVVQYYTDNDGNQQIKYIDGNSTSGFDHPVTGGHTTAVSFNNMYTKTDTGAFAVTKRIEGTDANALGTTLPGAEFTLTPDSDAEGAQAVITNINGTAYFSNLSEGTYTLVETKAPDGYSICTYEDGTPVQWGVQVSQANDIIKVEVWEKDTDGNEVANSKITCYEGGIKQSYSIENTPAHNTVTVTKTFTGITTDKLNELVANSSQTTDENGNVTYDGYVIQLQPAATAEPGGGMLGDADGKTNKFLTLQEAQRSQDGHTFTWTIDNVAQNQEVSYQLIEANYLLETYADTIVTAAVNSETVKVTIDRESERAHIPVTFHPEQRDTVEITNHYTNTFDLKLSKVDSESNAALSGAEFDIYGPYAESTNTAKKITYTDEQGITHTYYFIETITSDTNGIAVQKGLHLSKGENTFIYILHEFAAPEGYAPDTAPKVIKVTVGEDEYDGGIYRVEVPNAKKETATTEVTAEKRWNGSTPSNVSVSLELYRTVEGSNMAEKVADTVTLNGEDIDAEPADGTAMAGYASEEWTAKWINLPAYQVNKEDDKTEYKEYQYYVREAPVDGYVTSYSGENGELTLATLTVEVDGTKIKAAPAEAGVLGRLVRVTNTPGYVLPESGGGGTAAYSAIGGALMLMTSLWGMYMKKRLGRTKNKS